MNRKLRAFIALALSLTLVFASTVFAEDMGEPAEDVTEAAAEENIEASSEPEDGLITVKVPSGYEAYLTENAIAGLCIQLADTYYYGVSDEDLLYAALCSTIEKGYFDFNTAVERMMRHLDDGYSEYFSPERFESFYTSITGEFYGIGVSIMLSGDHVVVVSVFPDSPAEKAGLKPYDTILSIDGKSIAGLSTADVASLIKREKGARVTVSVMRGTQMLDIDCICDEVSQNPLSYEISGDNIGYIYLSTFSQNLDEFLAPVLKEFDEKGVKNVILDIRDNGGGELNAALDLAKYFVPQGVVAHLKYKNEENNEDLTIENGMKEPKYNLVLLVNENSASASELFSGAVKDRKAGTIIGTNTYGKGSMQSMFRLSGGAGVKYTVAEFYSPNDTRIHTVGVAPDIEVKNTVHQINEDDFAKLDLGRPDDTSFSQNVLAAEQRLWALGCLEEEPDEVFDSKTEEALRYYQSRTGNEITGTLDFYTLFSLDNQLYDFEIEDDDQLDAAYEYLRTGKVTQKADAAEQKAA